MVITDKLLLINLQGVTHQTISLGHWLTNIRMQHLTLDSTTLECNICSRVQPHQTATLYMLHHMKVLQSNVGQPQTKCHSLMWLNPTPNNSYLCPRSLPVDFDSKTIGGTILECINRSLVIRLQDFYMILHAKCCSLISSSLDQVLHSNVVEPKTKCCTLICVNQ